MGLIEQAPVGILGGGLCGLLAGRELSKRGVPFLILEAAAEPGGLAGSLRFSGVSGDTGPHALYSRSEKAMAFFRSLPIRYDRHRRKVRIVHHGSDGRVHEVGYPFENGVGDLPLPERVDCLVGYLRAQLGAQRRRYRDLKDWIERGLGPGIAGHFMLPYNRKIWNAALDRISLDLIKHKIEPAPVRTMLEAAMGLPTVGRKVQAEFLYPRAGIEELTRCLAGPLAGRLRLSERVLKVEREDGAWSVRTPKGRYRFSRLISTIPLKEFLKRQPFPALKPLGRALRHNDTLFVSVLLKDARRFRRFADCHWLFFAGPELFYRVNMMHVFRRSRRQHLVAEVTWKGAVKKMTRRARRERVLKDLLKAGILGRRGDVAGARERLVRYTYPIPTLGLAAVQARLDRALEAEGVYLLGRSGHWDYINVDQVVEKVWAFFRRVDDF